MTNARTRETPADLAAEFTENELGHVAPIRPEVVDVRVVETVRVEQQQARAVISDQVPVGIVAQRVIGKLRSRQSVTIGARVAPGADTIPNPLANPVTLLTGASITVPTATGANDLATYGQTTGGVATVAVPNVLAAGNTVDIFVQTSEDAANWTDAAQQLGAVAGGVYRLTVAGALGRYVRLSLRNLTGATPGVTVGPATMRISQAIPAPATLPRAADVWIGGPTVTPGSGYLLRAGDSMQLLATDSVYAVASADGIAVLHLFAQIREG